MKKESIMKTFAVKFKFKDKGISTTIKAENEAMAKQRILSLIDFVSVEEVEGLPKEFEGIFGKFR